MCVMSGCTLATVSSFTVPNVECARQLYSLESCLCFLGHEVVLLTVVAVLFVPRRPGRKGVRLPVQMQHICNGLFS